MTARLVPEGPAKKALGLRHDPEAVNNSLFVCGMFGLGDQRQARTKREGVRWTTLGRGEANRGSEGVEGQRRGLAGDT